MDSEREDHYKKDVKINTKRNSNVSFDRFVNKA
jgi:hypothetical protein